MATITCDVMRGAGVGIRCAINGYQFIECGVLRGAGVPVDAKVSAGIGTGIVVVDSWDPVANSVDVDHLAPFRVNCHAAPGSAEHAILFDGGGTFGADGTLDQAVEIGDGIQLDTNAPNFDFEDYTLNTAIDVDKPAIWQWLGGTSAWKWWTRSNAWDWDGQHIDILTGSGGSWTGYMGETFWAATYSLDVYHDSTGGTSGPTMGIGHQLTGSGTALRGYVAEFGTGQYLSLKRVYSATYHYGVGSINWGVMAEDVLYHVKFRFVNNGTTTWLYAKRWLDTDSEPADFTYVGADTAYANRAGWTGLFHKSGSGNYRSLADNFKIEPDPAVYYASGDWQSDELDTTPLGIYSYGKLTWDETTPAGTSIAVKARWRNGGTWLACTNGAEVPGIAVGSDTTAGSSKDSLELLVELATTDTSVTPLLENLLLYHEPLAPDGLGIDINGVVTCTLAAGTLDVWGKNQISGGSIVDGWDNIWMETYEPHHLHGLGRALVVTLLYGGQEVEDIVVTTRLDYWMQSGNLLGWQFSMNPIKYASAPVECRYNVHDAWSPNSHGYEWVLLDKGIGIHADGWYIVGRPSISDAPGFFIAGALAITDHPGSLLAKGWQRDDNLAQLLVQGYRHDDAPAMFLPGQWYVLDTPAHVLVAHVHFSEEQPGSVLVYSVNRDGHIELNVVDDTTWAAMLAAGYDVQ